MRDITKKTIAKLVLIAGGAVAMTGATGCAVYVPGPAVYARPGLVIAPAPVYVGGYYPRSYGYYGYYGWHGRGYCR